MDPASDAEDPYVSGGLVTVGFRAHTTTPVRRPLVRVVLPYMGRSRLGGAAITTAVLRGRNPAGD